MVKYTKSYPANKNLHHWYSRDWSIADVLTAHPTVKNSTSGFSVWKKMLIRRFFLQKHSCNHYGNQKSIKSNLFCLF